MHRIPSTQAVYLLDSLGWDQGPLFYTGSRGSFPSPTRQCLSVRYLRQDQSSFAVFVCLTDLICSFQWELPHCILKCRIMSFNHLSMPLSFARIRQIWCPRRCAQIPARPMGFSHGLIPLSETRERDREGTPSRSKNIRTTAIDKRGPAGRLALIGG